MERSDHHGAVHRRPPFPDPLRNARLRLHLPWRRARDELSILRDDLPPGSDRADEEPGAARPGAASRH